MNAGSQSPIVMGVDAEVLFGTRAASHAPDVPGLLPGASDEPEDLPEGRGLPLVKALLGERPDAAPGVEIVVVSRRSANAGLPLLASISRRAPGIERTVFTGGEPCVRYLRAFAVDLFVTCNEAEAREAVESGIPVALVQGLERSGAPLEQIRAVLDFDGSARGVAGGHEECDAADAGLEQVARLVLGLRGAADAVGTTLRVALVTSRGAREQERTIRGLVHSGLRVDEAFSLAGLPRESVLGELGPHLLFATSQLPAAPEEKPEPPAAVPELHEEFAEAETDAEVEAETEFEAEAEVDAEIEDQAEGRSTLETPLGRLRGRWARPTG